MRMTTKRGLKTRSISSASVFFTLKDFSNQGRAYFSEGLRFRTGGRSRKTFEFPDLKIWLPELAERFETMDSFTEPEIEEVVKAFTEEKGTKLGVIMNGARTLLNRCRRRPVNAFGVWKL